MKQVPYGDPPPFEPMVIATRCPSRSPEWKTHAHMGLARAAITTRAWIHLGEDRQCPDHPAAHPSYYGVEKGQIWQMVDGEWKLVHDIKSGTRFCDLPWKLES